MSCMWKKRTQNKRMSRKAKYEYAKLKSKTVGQQNLYITSVSEKTYYKCHENTVNILIVFM